MPGFQNAHVLKGIERICDKDKIFRGKPHSLFSFRLENDGMQEGHWELPITRM